MDKVRKPNISVIPIHNHFMLLNTALDAVSHNNRIVENASIRGIKSEATSLWDSGRDNIISLNFLWMF
jgi:hypothetical protein